MGWDEPSSHLETYPKERKRRRTRRQRWVTRKVKLTPVHFYQKLFKFYRTAITVKSHEENASVDKMRRVSKTRYHTASCARKIWTLENITKEQKLWRVKCEILFSTRGMWLTVLTVADNLIVHNNMYFVSLSVSFSLNLFYKLLVSFSLFR